MTRSSDKSRPAAGGGGRVGTGARAGRFVVGALALAALALVIAQAGRLPGPAGAALRANLDAGRDATGLFYTEVEGWTEWFARPRPAGASASSPRPQ